MAWRGSPTGPGLGAGRVWPKPSGAKWRSGWKTALTARPMDGGVRWRWADLGDRIAANFHVHLHERSVGKLPKKRNFSSMSGRPVHPRSGLEAPGFEKNFAGRARAAIPRELAGRSKSGSG
jgi:hypothetical protein